MCVGEIRIAQDGIAQLIQCGVLVLPFGVKDSEGYMRFGVVGVECEGFLVRLKGVVRLAESFLSLADVIAAGGEIRSELG